MTDRGYPTERCPHCTLVRCYPGQTTCHDWPGSLCPPAPPLPRKMSNDGRQWWDPMASEWRMVIT